MIPVTSFGRCWWVNGSLVFSQGGLFLGIEEIAFLRVDSVPEVGVRARAAAGVVTVVVVL